MPTVTYVSTAVASTVTQLSLTPSPQSTVSVSAASASLSFFRKDVNPKPFTSPLPGPNESVQTTRQLAYCLALSQPSIQEDELSPEDLVWRQNMLSNSNEKDDLETLAAQIIQEFAKDIIKDAYVVFEVVQLAPVLNEDQSRFLLKTFIDTVNQSEVLHLHSLGGLAKVIRGAASRLIDSDDLVSILRSLHRKLQSTHSGSNRNRYHLLFATSQVLDAMVDSSVGDVDRVNLHGPLTDLLRESESSKDPYLTFQAQYATQALLNVSDDDDIWHAGSRGIWLVLKGGAGLGKISDPREIKDALEGLERLYEAGKGGARMLKDALQSIKSSECPEFTVKEGLKFKRSWYRALRKAESYTQAGSLTLFKDLVTTAPCRDQLMFQWGICQLLGGFATDTQLDTETRQDAVAFLGVFYRGTGLWRRQQAVDQVVFDALTKVVSNDDTAFEGMTNLYTTLFRCLPIRAGS